jgi:hypothetical protein
MTEFWAYPLRFGQTLSSSDWVEFHIHRFLTSRFKAYCLRDGEAGRAIGFTALLRWSECYRQDPAGMSPGGRPSATEPCMAGGPACAMTGSRG